jgi:hypothetical protein
VTTSSRPAIPLRGSTVGVCRRLDLGAPDGSRKSSLAQSAAPPDQQSYVLTLANANVWHQSCVRKLLIRWMSAWTVMRALTRISFSLMTDRVGSLQLGDDPRAWLASPKTASFTLFAR